MLNYWTPKHCLSSSSITLELTKRVRYLGAMARELFHPETEQIQLSAVLDALSDPIRRNIVLGLAEDGEQNCSCFTGLSSKTNLTYHAVRLREAGLTRTRIVGSQRLITLRAGDIEARFPGLLVAILAGARRERRLDVMSDGELAP
jgi:DNA-binding transcriptional ArsR family regulator